MIRASAAKPSEKPAAFQPTLAAAIPKTISAAFVAQKSAQVGRTPSSGPSRSLAQPCQPSACSSTTCRALATSRTQRTH